MIKKMKNISDAAGNISKGVRAVFFGFLAVAALSMITDFMLESAGIFSPATEGLFIPWMLLLALAYRTVFTVFGGYLTAWLAPSLPWRHVIILGVIGTITGTLGVLATWGKGFGPEWYPISLAVLAYPSVWLGGKIFEVRTK